MKASELSVEFVESMGTDLTPVNAARISFNSNSEILSDKDKKLIKFLADHDHMTPFEHQIMTVIIKCPLYIRSQIHRHRTFSFNERSFRYSSEELEFYFPPITDIRKQSLSNKQGSNGVLDTHSAQVSLNDMRVSTAYGLDYYNILLKRGVAREQARSILPQNLMTKFYMTGNLRNWCHFLELRLDPSAQSEVRDIAKKVALLIKERWPVSYDCLMENSQ